MKTLSNFILPAACVLLLSGMYIIPYYYYNDLPDQVPVHFNSEGKVNAMGGKHQIYFIPMIATALFLFIELLSKVIPFIINRFDYLDTEKQEFLRLAILMLRTFGLLFTAVFFYITLATVKIALGYWEGISSRLTFTIFFFLFLIMILFVYRFAKIKEGSFR